MFIIFLFYLLLRLELSPLHIQKIYSLSYRRLHWSLAAIIIILLIAGQQFNFDISDAYRIQGLKAHSSLGTVSLIIVLFLLFKRFIQRCPVPKAKLSRFKLIAARCVQYSLYLLAIIIPISGLSSALFSPQPVYLFAIFDLSSLQVSNQDTFIFLRDIHLWATRVAMFLLVNHAGAALYHHFVVKDDVLKSMVAKDPLLTKLYNLLKPSKKSVSDNTTNR